MQNQLRMRTPCTTLHDKLTNHELMSPVALTDGYADVWLGITDDGHQNQLTWVDATSLTFTNWKAISELSKSISIYICRVLVFKQLPE